MWLPQGHSPLTAIAIAASPPQPAGHLNVNKVRVQSKPPAVPCRSRCLRAPHNPPGQLRPPPPESERVARAAAGSLKPQEGRGGRSVLAAQCRAGRGGVSTEHRGPQRSVQEQRPSACRARQVWAHMALCHEPSAAPNPSFPLTQLCPMGRPPADTGAGLRGRHCL